jgi:hemerythrin-like domain-containing protein
MIRKPITRNEHIKKLSRDHHFSLLFCWKLRQGLKNNLEPQRIGEYVQYFWQQNLQPHFKEEEKILFAAIKDRQVQRAINEHKQIRQQIQDLANNSGKNDTLKTLARIADMVDDHVRYEERTLFPHLEKKLNKEQLKNIGEQIQKYSSPLIDQYEDEFWNINAVSIDK